MGGDNQLLVILDKSTSIKILLLKSHNLNRYQDKHNGKTNCPSEVAATNSGTLRVL